MNAVSGEAAPGPLAGVRVIDLTVNILGPLATQILGDMGADVIKVETPEGDPMRHSGPSRHKGMAALFMNTNRNKRSVVLDLKRKPALDALMCLIDGADVFVHSLRPASAERLGIAYGDLSRRNPRLVYGYAPGYRPDGPHRDRPAFDDVIQGESGIAAMLARNDGEPRYIPMVIADKLCGHVLASAIGMALYARERTGIGQEVVVPMFETTLSFNLVEHLWLDFFEGADEDVGYARMFSPHRRPYATQDGHICLLAVSDEQWRRLFGALGRPELARDERYATLHARTRNINALYALVAEEIRRRSTAEWQTILDAADVPNGAVQSLRGLARQPYLEQTRFFQHYTHPSEGTMVTTSVPVQFARTPGSIRRPPPQLGEHTESVLREAGCTNAEIAALTPARAGTSC